MANGKWRIANGKRDMAYRLPRRSALRPVCSEFLYLLSAIRHTLTDCSLLPALCSLRSLFLSFLLATALLAGVALAVEGDVVFQRKGEQGTNPAAVFPHWVHRIRYKCYACHPSPFRMEAGANQISMELIQEGKSCGVCHNGKRTWGVSFATCNRCHAGQ